METVKPPRGDVASTEVTLRELVRVLLQYSDDISLVLLFKMIMDPVPILKGPQLARKGLSNTLVYSVLWNQTIKSSAFC